jgi:hypothetical protein
LTPAVGSDTPAVTIVWRRSAFAFMMMSGALVGRPATTSTLSRRAGEYPTRCASML